MEYRLEYHTRWGENLFICHLDKVFPMSWTAGDIWMAEFEKPLKNYFYAVYRDGRLVRREQGEHFSNVRTEGTVNDRWIDFPYSRAAGTAVPVFSLRSKEDFGIGDFGDLNLLTDWAAACGQKIIQLLPVNDTTRKGGWEDSYPYRPVSSFALNPMYFRLPEFQDEEFRKEREELNASDSVDYPRVFAAKMKYLHRAFAQTDLSKEKGFRTFCRNNAFWLEEYVSFCSDRDGCNDADFYRWTQFRLHFQLSSATGYARSKGIVFKGDLPIGVSADSADAVFHPQLFNLGCCAGAPPDYFSADGQNWGFPTYNWEEMEKDGYSWWKKRLRVMVQYFGAFRVDHILGWFRIWEIPEGESGKRGHFNPALPYSKGEIERMGLPLSEDLFTEVPAGSGHWHPLISPDTSALSQDQKRTFDALWEDFFFHRHEGFWKGNALRKVPALLGATSMLPCGEDLGMVPDCVNEVMEDYRILSLELPSFQKNRPWPYLSVCTTSTHDMLPLRCNGSADKEPWECENAVRSVLSSCSMLAILPLQDWLSINGQLRCSDPLRERINDPADPDNHWCWRMHLNLEDLRIAHSFRAQMEGLLKDSGRWSF